MSNPRAEALPALERWLVNHGVPQDSAVDNTENVKFFYSTALYHLRPPVLEIGISARKPRLEKPSILLHMIWPKGFQTVKPRTEHEIDYQKLFSKEVAQPSLSAIGLGLRFCDMDSFDGSSEELMRGIAIENRASYLGIVNGLSSVISLGYWSEMTRLLRTANAIADISTNGVSQISLLCREFPYQSRAKQRTVLKEARGYLVAMRKEMAKAK